MATKIPTAQQVKSLLEELAHSEVAALSRASQVPFTTLLKIKSGETADPRLSTVRAIWPELSRKRRTKAVA
jgi:hypothetical protein